MCGVGGWGGIDFGDDFGDKVGEVLNLGYGFVMGVGVGDMYV